MNQFIALLFTLISGLLITLGFFLAKGSKEKEKFTQFSISMAFGVMLMLSLLELLKEAVDVLKEQIGENYIIYLVILIIVGIAFLKILDFFVPDHHHHDGHEDENLYHVGVVSCIALLLHNILEGMTIYTTASTDFKMGFLMVVGVGLHNIPMGMVIYSTLSKTKDTRKKKIGYLALVTFSTLIGGFIMFLASNYITDLLIGILLAITLGMIFYIAFFELLKEMIEYKNKKRTILGVLTGIFLFFVSYFLG